MGGGKPLCRHRPAFTKPILFSLSKCRHLGRWVDGRARAHGGPGLGWDAKYYTFRTLQLSRSVQDYREAHPRLWIHCGIICTITCLCCGNKFEHILSMSACIRTVYTCGPVNHPWKVLVNAETRINLCIPKQASLSTTPTQKETHSLHRPFPSSA